jgi:hypothetical protein
MTVIWCGINVERRLAYTVSLRMVDDRTERITVYLYTMAFRPNWRFHIELVAQNKKRKEKVRRLGDGKIPNWDPKTQARWALIFLGIRRKNESEHGARINP